MSFRALLLWRSFSVLFLLALLTAPAAFGQLKDAKGNLISPVAFANQDAITTTFVTSPNLSGMSAVATSGNATSSDTPPDPSDVTNQWLKVEFHYGTTAALKTKYLDSVEFKVWIEGRDLLATNAPVPGKGIAVALTGSVTYINVPAGSDIYGVFYVHPSTLGRYSGEHGVTDFDRKFDVHMEAYVGGTLMDKIDKNKEQDPNWFQPLVPITGLVYRQDQSPFIIVDPDRYPAIKLPTTAQ
jgi:hypothetical protein